LSSDPNRTGTDERHALPGLGRGRLESLTDGIFGTVMTVLILSLSVPVITRGPVAAENSQLADYIHSLIPDILSYVISFVVLGAFWMRHHMMFNFVSRVDRTLLWLNIFFLLTIGFIPFSTALMGRYPLLQIPLAVYGANLFATSATSQFLWIYVGRNKLLGVTDKLDERIMSTITRRMSLGPAAYLVAIAISFYYPYATLAIYVAVLIFLLVNTTTGFRVNKNSKNTGNLPDWKDPTASSS